MNDALELVNSTGDIAKAILIVWAIITWIAALFYKRIKDTSYGHKYAKAWTYGCCIHFALAMIFAYFAIGDFSESIKYVSNTLYCSCFVTFGLFIKCGKIAGAEEDEGTWKFFIWSLASCLYFYFSIKFKLGMQEPPVPDESVSWFVIVSGLLQAVTGIGCLGGIMAFPFLSIWVVYKLLCTIFKSMFE